MAVLIANRGAQTLLYREFTFNWDDTMLDINGVSKDFNDVETKVFDVINMPLNAVVVGGDVTTETAVTGSTAYNVSVGDSGSATRYLGVTDKTSAARTALVPTGYVGAGEAIRLTITPTVAASTAGKLTLRVAYIIRERTTEVQPH